MEDGLQYVAIDVRDVSVLPIKLDVVLSTIPVPET